MEHPEGDTAEIGDPIAVLIAEGESDTDIDPALADTTRPGRRVEYPRPVHSTFRSPADAGLKRVESVPTSALLRLSSSHLRAAEDPVVPLDVPIQANSTHTVRTLAYG